MARPGGAPGRAARRTARRAIARRDLGPRAEVLHRLVDDQQVAGLRTDATTVSMSSGDQRAHVRPPPARPGSSSAAARHARSVCPQVTTVTPSPSRATRALPSGSGRPRRSPAHPVAAGGSRRRRTGLGSRTDVEQQVAGVGDRRRDHHLQARDVREHRLEDCECWAPALLCPRPVCVGTRPGSRAPRRSCSGASRPGSGSGRCRRRRSP